MKMDISYRFISTVDQEMQYSLLQHEEFLLLIVVLPFPMMVNGLKMKIGARVTV